MFGFEVCDFLVGEMYVAVRLLLALSLVQEVDLESVFFQAFFGFNQ